MIVDLKDKVALVTGSAGAIGSATAWVFAADGTEVIIANVNEARARSTAAEIPGALPPRLEVSSKAAVRAGVDWVQLNYATHPSSLCGPAGDMTVYFSAFCVEAGRRTDVDDRECISKK